jgi:hypothetical protein
MLAILTLLAGKIWTPIDSPLALLSDTSDLSTPPVNSSALANPTAWPSFYTKLPGCMVNRC